MIRGFAVAFLVIIAWLGGLSACGKSGDPYRPSEIPKKSSGN